ncbi:MAG: hypothetical protein RLZ22_1170 [Verrucomicrobiota bacterium]
MVFNESFPKNHYKEEYSSNPSAIDLPQPMKVVIVHYHLAASGVSSVIKRASRELTRRGVSHVIIVGQCPGDLDESLPVRVVDGLGYSDAPLVQEGAEKILNELRATATEAFGAPPDLWHFHNHSLGKNRVVPQIVSMLAKQRERMLLHIHDLAEDGRPENAANIVDVPMLYPIAPQIHYAFINSRDQQNFIEAGLPASNAHLVPNPVGGPASSAHRKPISRNQPPLLLCPARGIRRKNIGELILLTLLAPAGTRTAITLAPENPQWLAIHDRWKHFCAENHLPVEFAVVDRIAPDPDSDASFESWISHATHFVTCSVSEGFGLIFLESISYEKPLIGHKIDHVSRDLAEHGIEYDGLYEKILIPIDWIPQETLKHHIETALTYLWQAWNREAKTTAIKSIVTSIEYDGFLDFGNLPEVIQETVIKKILDADHQTIPMVMINGQASPLKAWLDDVLTQTHQRPVCMPEAFSNAAHGEQTFAIYAMMADQNPSRPTALDPHDILEKFLVSEEFHFLKSPPDSNID